MIPASRVARSLVLMLLVALAGCQPPGQTGGEVTLARRHAGPGAHPTAPAGEDPPLRGGPFLPPDQPAPLPSAAPRPSTSPTTSPAASPAGLPAPDAPASPAALPSAGADASSPAPDPSPTPAATPSPPPVASPSPTAAASAPPPSPTPVPTPRPSPLARSEEDRVDDEAGYQIHVVYAVPSDGDDRGFDTDGSITRSVYTFDDWLFRKTKRQRLRFDRSGGALDVSYVRLTETDAALAANRRRLRDAIERGLRERGFRHPQKMYAVYYDGTNPEVCGGAPWPPTVPGTVAALYLKGEPGCDSTGWTPDGVEMTYREFAMLHELVHGFGFVPRTAPHHTMEGHTSGSYADLMYTGSETWIPRVLDSTKEIYDHGRTDTLDLAKSVFLTPSAPDAAPPPIWSTSVGSP